MPHGTISAVFTRPLLQTGQTKLTLKLDFPGNLWLAAFAILVMFSTEPLSFSFRRSLDVCSNMIYSGSNPGGIFSYCVRARAYTHVLARVYSTCASTCTLYTCFILPPTRVDLTWLASLSFLASSVVCDWDKNIHVVKQMFYGGICPQLISLL